MSRHVHTPEKNFVDQMIKGRVISLNFWDVAFGPPCMMNPGMGAPGYQERSGLIRMLRLRSADIWGGQVAIALCSE